MSTKSKKTTKDAVDATVEKKTRSRSKPKEEKEDKPKVARNDGEDKPKVSRNDSEDKPKKTVKSKDEPKKEKSKSKEEKEDKPKVSEDKPKKEKAPKKSSDESKEEKEDKPKKEKAPKKVKEDKPKKDPKPAKEYVPAMETTGVAISLPRVKRLLSDNLDDVASEVVEELNLAKGYDEKKLNKNGEMVSVEVPPQPISKLSKRTQDYVREAEARYVKYLTHEYEKEVIKNWDSEKKLRYHEDKKNAKKNADSSDDGFNRRFNESFQNDFYSGYDAFVKQKDKLSLDYVSDDADSKAKAPADEWSRAIRLVTKNCSRIAFDTRVVVSCFLDRVVEQLAHNGIVNAKADVKKNVSLRYVLQNGDDYSTIVPLHSLLSTLKCYTHATTWLSSNSDDSEENNKYSGDGSDKYKTFSIYVHKIFSDVRHRVVESCANEEDAKFYSTMNASKEFKIFCSLVVYELVERISALLRESTVKSEVKTVSGSLVYYALRQLHIATGLDYTQTYNRMQHFLDIYHKANAQKKKSREDSKNE